MNGNDYPEKRTTERLDVMNNVSVTLGDEAIDCILMDIGAGGAKIHLPFMATDDLVAEAAEIVLHIPKFGEFDGSVVWNAGKLVGIQFSEKHKALVSLIRESAAVGSAA